ncbi:DNA glycosylase, partial [Neoconidiobolus thromboides FSU 785]
TFGYLGRNIIFQQLSGKAASTIESRFLNLYKVEAEETYFPTPEQVLATDNEALRGVGLSMAKALYIKDLALHYQNGSLSDIKLKEADDKTVYELLIQVKGIGPWTIDMFLMSYLKRLDVLPLGDLGIKKGMIKHFELTVSDKKKLIDEKDMIELSKAWRPYRSVASWLMWEIANTITAT